MAGLLPHPDAILVDEAGAALACYADGRPVIVHPSMPDLLAMHGLLEADLQPAEEHPTGRAPESAPEPVRIAA
jgi:hypothetical protein